MAFRIQGSVNSAQGPALQGVEVYVCTQPASTGSIPPSPLATLYTDSTGATQLTQPISTDGLGNWFAYAATGTYTFVYYDPLNRIPTTVFVDQQCVSPGGGSVTSVGLTMDGVIFAASVPGSPITSSGTFVPPLNTVLANYVLAGPTSGSAANPSYRKLVSADFPAGVGTVTSVAISTTGTSALLTATVSGSPITGSGTITIPINFANFSANAFLAGPTSGAATTPTARAIVSGDIAGIVAVASSATPTFNLSSFAIPTFTITLTSNVTSFTLSNPTAGQVFFIKWIQNATGNFTVVFPATVFGDSEPDPDPNAVTMMSFVCISSTEYRVTSTWVNQS